MRLDVAAQTDTGRRKNKNEDCCGVYQEETPGLRLFSEGALLCVADGLGGHMSGEIASKLAVSIVRDMLNSELPPANGANNGDQSFLTAIRQAILRANESIWRTNQDLVRGGRPMGTTLLAAIVQPKKVYIGNVGDSRAYHLREGHIIARTEDHSWVDEQVKLGRMSKAEAESDLRKNIVTRCVGTHPEIDVDTYIWNIEPGDMLLLCTDGLVNMVSDSEILEIFRKGGTAAEIARRLVERANENGGKDNITVIVANISPSLPRLIWLKIRAIARRTHLTPALLVFLFFYGLLCAAGGYLFHLYYPDVLQELLHKIKVFLDLA
jgi:protein phosphatase